MKNNFLLITGTFLLSGCAGFNASSECDGPVGQRVTIHYGDGELTVTPKVPHVSRGGEFRLRLAPRKRTSDEVDYEVQDVTVFGKNADDQVWITMKTETYESAANHRIFYCVPPDQAAMVYEYKVTVETVGMLDPRVDVD